MNVGMNSSKILYQDFFFFYWHIMNEMPSVSRWMIINDRSDVLNLFFLISVFSLGLCKHKIWNNIVNIKPCIMGKPNLRTINNLISILEMES